MKTKLKTIEADGRLIEISLELGLDISDPDMELLGKPSNMDHEDFRQVLYTELMKSDRVIRETSKNGLQIYITNPRGFVSDIQSKLN